MRRGLHAIYDFENLIIPTININTASQDIFNLMQTICEKYHIKVVAKNLVVFSNPEVTPPGFTSCLLLDESHLSFHLYSELGIAAVDFFTCGNPVRGKQAASEFKNCLIEMYPEIKLTHEQYIERF